MSTNDGMRADWAQKDFYAELGVKKDATTADIPVVIVSILDESAKGAEHGAAGYLVKPVGRESLLSVLAGIGAMVPASVAAGNNERSEAP